MTSPRPLKSNGLDRPKPFTFYPPKNNRVVATLVKSLLKRDIRRKVKVTEIDVPQESLERLKALRGRRCLLTPSHSGGYEPHIIMYLSKLLDDDYNYLAAIELFVHSPLQRWVLQRLGVYSIIRGTTDRSSFSMTRQLLAEGKRWLVIFPEGETIWQNSTVMPFQQGVIQLAFKGYEDAAKTEKQPSLYCVPIAVRYVYLEDMHREIDLSLARLESQLSLPATVGSRSRSDRLHDVAEAALAANERVHRVTPEVGASLDDRIQDLKERVTTRLEEQLGIEPAPGHPLLDRIRTLFNTVDRIVEQPPPASEYERELASERQHAARLLYDDLWRALRFVAIYDGYVRESKTVERFLDVLCMLEFEVFKRRRLWGPRKACVQVGQPVNLKDHYSSYLTDKRGTAERIAVSLESTVRSMLGELEAGCQPLRPSD
jgi:1-acyl-sn-glycerol-3-phosphate acyltransferase